MRRRTFDYARATTTATDGRGLRAIGASLCVSGAVAGVLFIMIGVTYIDLAQGPRSQLFHSGAFLAQGGLASVIGLLMTGFSIRWFIIAVRLRRTRPPNAPPLTTRVEPPSPNKGSIAYAFSGDPREKP